MPETDHRRGASKPAGRTASPGRPDRLRELDRSECLDLLAANRFGRVVVSTVATRTPIIRPVNYVFDVPSQSVVFQTVDGSKLHAILHSANACFEIDAIDADGRRGWSVIIVGVTEEVTHPAEIDRLERLGPESWISPTQAHWIRVRAWTVSGRRLEPEPDDRPPRSP
jgi:uncharacterized protein